MSAKGFFEIDYEKQSSPSVGVGVLGYGFMGKVHSNAYLKIPYSFKTPPAVPALMALCGRNAGAVEDTARRFRYRGYNTDWRALISDSHVDIVDICTPDNLHAEMGIAACEAGKHVIYAGWEYGHLHALNHFVNCVVSDAPVGPYGATFEDGYRTQVIIEVIVESARTGHRVEPEYR